VLLAEATAFKLHRTRLAAQSNVFADMFPIPQPPATSQSESLDGCPMVTLQDAARDVAINHAGYLV